jgi:hypothetical protein
MKKTKLRLFSSVFLKKDEGTLHLSSYDLRLSSYENSYIGTISEITRSQRASTERKKENGQKGPSAENANTHPRAGLM